MVFYHLKSFTAPAERMVFIATGDAKGVPALMTRMKKLGIALITIYERPLKTELGQYYYLIECTNSGYEDYKKLAEAGAFTYRYLGSFDAL